MTIDEICTGLRNVDLPDARFQNIEISPLLILIDDSYNANLESTLAALDYLNAFSGSGNKIFILGDMLELGKHSKKLHQSISPLINKSKIDKVFVKGNKVISLFKKLTKSKKGGILYNNSQIIELIKNRLNNNDYLMIKASNATGFNRIVQDLKGQK